MITIVLALLMLLLSTGLALAEPISATIGLTALIGSTLGVGVPTAAAVGGFLVSGVATVGLTLGLGALSKALAGKPKAGETLSGLEANVQIGGDIARQIAIGACGSKGQLVYHNSPPSQQHEFYQQVYVLSDWLCEGLGSLFVNGKAVTLTASPAGGGLINYSVAEHPTRMTVAFYDGSQTVANASLVSLAQPAGRWTTNSKLSGMSYAFVSWTYEKGAPLYESGIPKLTFGLKGARLYDWRKDSTAGGVGAQRWIDPATWAYSENPAVAVYNYLRGFYRSGELIMGMGVPASDILINSFTSAANVCDEPVVLEVGGSEARYRLCSFLSADQAVTHAQTLEVLLSTMAGYLYDYGGAYWLQAGAGYSTVATVTDNDLVTGVPAAFTAKRSRSELINRIHGQFVNPADEFQPSSYTPQISTTAVGVDMEELGRQLDLASVPSQYQAERIAKIRLNEVRKQASATITLGFEHLNKQVGDWINWASGRYGSRTWRIVNKMVDPTSQTVALEITETHADVYGWTILDEGDPAQLGLPLVATSLITQPTAFLVFAVTLTDANSNQVPGLKFTWNPITDPTVDTVVIEWRKLGTTIATRASDPSVADGTFQTTDGVVGGLDYEARATITTTPPRITTWTDWVTVRTTSTFFNLSSAVDPAASIPTGLVLSSAIETLATGETQTRLDADWADVTGATNVTYEIDIKEGAGNYVTFPTAHSNYQWRGLRSGTVVTARVRSITALGTPSGYSPEVTHTVATDSIPPAAIAFLTGTAAFQSMFLNWNNPPDADYAYARLFISPTNNIAAHTALPVIEGPPSGTSSYTLTGVPPGATRYFWVQPCDTSGNFGPTTPASPTGGFALTALSIITADIAANAVDQTKFANNMQPVGVIANTAAAHVPNIDTALNTADGKLYRWTGTAWTAAVPAVDITGQLTDAQLAAIAAAKVTGQIVESQIYGPALSENLLYNGDPDARDLGIAGWALHEGTAYTLAIASSGVPAGIGPKAFRISKPAAANTVGYGSRSFPVQAGRQYRIRGKYAGSVATTGGAYLRVAWMGALPPDGIITSTNRGGFTDFASDVPFSTTPVAIDAVWTAPAGAVFALVVIYNWTTNVNVDAYYDEIAVHAFGAASLVKPGALLADSIVADSITSAQIAANAITATELAADSVIAVKIKAGEVVAGKLAADSVVAANIAALAVTAGKIAANAVSTNELSANAVTAAKIAADTITAAQIAAGAINVDELAARAVTTEKLAVGSRNVAFNGEFNVGPAINPMSGWVFINGATGSPSLQYAGSSYDYGPTGLPVAFVYAPGVPSGITYVLNTPLLFSGLQQRYIVQAGNVYEASVALSTHRCSAGIFLRFYNSSGAAFASGVGNFIDSNGATGPTNGGPLTFPRSSVMITAPAGAVSADIYIQTNYDGVRSDCYTFFSALYFAGAQAENLTKNPGGLPAFSPYQPPGITIIERGQIKTGEVITEHMVANTILGDRIQTDTLNANKITAGTVMSGTVIVNGQYLQDTTSYAFDPVTRSNTVGGNLTGPTLNGTAIPTVVSGAALGAQDPATRINANTTRINPGNILISGGTTLSSWRDGGDLTQISGGAIAANTIATNKIKIGARGLNVVQCDFWVTPGTNTVNWTSGAIAYVNDAGSNVYIGINAGSAAMAPGYIIYWQKDTNNFNPYPNPYDLANADLYVIMATYNGGGALNVLYGGTVIEGSRITTGSVNADRIVANTITATQVLQSAALIVNTAMIQDLTVSTLKVVDGNISAVYAASKQAGPGENTFPAAIAALVGRRFLISFVATDNAAIRTSAAGFSSVARQFSIYMQNGAGGNTLLMTTWGWDTVVGFGSGIYSLAFPNVVGQIVAIVPATDNYTFFVQNQAGITSSVVVTVTELKR